MSDLVSFNELITVDHYKACTFGMATVFV